MYHKIIGIDGFFRTADSAYIPIHDENADYILLKQWMEEGNAPEIRYPPKPVYEEERRQRYERESEKIGWPGSSSSHIVDALEIIVDELNMRGPAVTLAFERLTEIRKAVGNAVKRPEPEKKDKDDKK